MREGLGSIPLLSYKGSYLLAFFSCFFLFGSASVILLCLSTTFSNDLGTKLTAIWDLGGFSGEGRTGVGVVSKKRGVHMRKNMYAPPVHLIKSLYLHLVSAPYAPVLCNGAGVLSCR